MANLKWRVAAIVVLAASGALFFVSGKTADGRSLRPGGNTEIIDLVRSASFRSRELTQRVEALRADVDRLAAAEQNPAADDVQEAVDELRPQVGLTPMVGPGLTVTLDDAPVPGDGDSLPADTTYDDYVVHQQDLEGVINAMWAGGAEAMMIMDQRIISTSAVRCVGNVLILHGQVYSPPFTVTAVGDVDGMRRALEQSTAVRMYREWASYIGLGYEVEQQDSVRIPEYGGSLELDHTRAEAQ